MVEMSDAASARIETSVECMRTWGRRIDVPLFRQEKDSSSCGLYCLKMLYHYYGRDCEVADITAAVELIPTGVYAQELGYHLLRNGFRVTLITRDTSRFPLLYGRMPIEELRGVLDGRLAAIPPGQKEGAYWRGMLRFLDAGGQLELRAPTIEETLAPPLRQGHPVIVCLDAKALYDFQDLADGPVDEHSYGQAGHYVVVTGLDEQDVTMADPSATFGGINRYPRPRFLYAWYSYQAYTILAEPR